MSQTASNKTRRFDLYTGVHKALRAFMADTLTTVGRIDPEDDSDVFQGLEKVRLLLSICRDHLEHENRVIHPAMEARAPQSSKTTADDHALQEEVFDRLEAEIMLVELGSALNRGQRLLELYRSLSKFVAVNFEHMLVEETENQTALWEVYSDDELLGIHRSLVAAVEPEKMNVYLQWMIPYLSPPERRGLLAGLQATTPPEVFERILLLAEPEFSPARA